jgi:hypothetical protein
VVLRWSACTPAAVTFGGKVEGVSANYPQAAHRLSTACGHRARNKTQYSFVSTSGCVAATHSAANTPSSHQRFNMPVRTRVVGVPVLPLLSDKRGMTRPSSGDWEANTKYKKQVVKAIEDLLERNPIDNDGTREGKTPGYDEVRTPHPSPAHQDSTPRKPD